MDLDIGSGRQEVFAVGNKSVSGKEGKSMSLMGLWINLSFLYVLFSFYCQSWKRKPQLRNRLECLTCEYVYRSLS